MAASVIACRVAALFSSRREVGAAPGAASDPPDGATWAAEGDGEEGTRLHYVHVCTLRKYFPGSPARRESGLELGRRAAGGGRALRNGIAPRTAAGIGQVDRLAGRARLVLRQGNGKNGRAVSADFRPILPNR